MMGASRRSDHYDVVFAGAGLAGLSLAVRLAALPDPPRIALIDPRSNPPRDRTWCHWQLHEHPFTAAVTHRWYHWEVCGMNRPAAARRSPHPYTRIPSDRFFQVAAGKLSDLSHVQFYNGCSVAHMDESPDGAILHLTDGRTICSDWVFDSRPVLNCNAPWRQIFRGLELHSNAANLNKEKVTLMDFVSAGGEGIRFFYVLPLDAHTALVEDTWLVHGGQTPPLNNESILNYAREKLAPVDWTIRHQEEGNLPMGQTLPTRYPLPRNHHPRIIPWGTPAGALRASSGYAFSRIQRASDRMTEAWQKNGRPDPACVRESPLLDRMDRVFLRAMARHPEQAPDFFCRLFDRVPPGALIRFLESEPLAADLWHVMRALPAAPFLAAAIR